MKAAEWTRKILIEAQPVLVTDEQPVLDQLAAAQHQLDAGVKQIWKSNVGGSGGPECLIAGALQSLENKGYRLQPYSDLLADGLKAVADEDYERLHLCSARIWRIMRDAVPDPDHPSQKTRRYADWSAFDKDVDWPAATSVDVTANDFVQSVEAGWRAQLIGAAVGTALEGYTAPELLQAYGPIRNYVRKPNTLNDDITYELAFLEAYVQSGPAVSSDEIAELWVRIIPQGWSAETVALTNLRMGLFPPKSGIVGNPFDEWIGAQMRGAICGMVAPGNPREAARLAWIDAEISHAGNGILGEIFNAVMVALSFSEGSTRTLLQKTIALFPVETEYRQVLDFAMSAAIGAKDWRDAWHQCDRHFADYNWIHAYPNAAAEVVALWFGDGDFDTTLEIVAGIGHDVDCNAAQVMNVIGIQRGLASIAPRWLGPLGDQVDTLMRRPKHLTVDALVNATVGAVRKWNL